MTRFPKQESKQQALRRQVGEDVARLLECVDLEDDSLGVFANCPLSHGSDRSLLSKTRVHRQGYDGVMDAAREQ
jgi:hypothetical protein